MNDRYSLEQLAATHGADHDHEAERASLAGSATRGEPGAGHRASSRLPRAARGVILALGLTVLVVAPVAAAAPTRTVRNLPADRVAHFAAGEGCTFDATVYSSPKGRVTVTDFSDGTEVYEVHAMQRTIVSDVTHKSFVENQEYRDIEWIDASTGLRLGETSGQFIDTFWPGDIGPYGVVDENVSYAIVGSQTYTLDPNSYATLVLSIKGTITNICAVIS